MKKPKVSVVIPAYNAMSFLPKTLNSVLSQTFQDYEIIIVNDGSSDKINEWAKQISDSRVRLISQENQGQSAARNTGLNLARGEYIAFLDSDDLWEPTKLEKQVRVLEEFPEVGFVYTWVALVDNHDKLLGKAWRGSFNGDVWAKLIEGNFIACGSIPMVRRTCIDTVGSFRQLSFACEDWDMWLRIAAHYSFKAIEEILVYYRANPQSLSRSWKLNPEKKLHDMEQSYNFILENAFKSAPKNLQNIKKRSYAITNLRIAWKALGNFDRGYKYAEHFCQQAVYYYPQICSSQEYKRLKNAISVVRLFGYESYSKYRKVKTAVYDFTNRIRSKF